MRACALSSCCRHLLAAAGKGFLFRYEYNPRPPSAPQVPERTSSQFPNIELTTFSCFNLQVQLYRSCIICAGRRQGELRQQYGRQGL